MAKDTKKKRKGKAEADGVKYAIQCKRYTSCYKHKLDSRQ